MVLKVPRNQTCFLVYKIDMEDAVHVIITVVCVSNTCRSPMVESLLRHLLIEKGGNPSQFTVQSRGITEDYEPAGSPASPQAVQVLNQDYGLDLTSHRSRILSEEDVQNSLLIVPVKKELGRSIKAMFPGSTSKLRYFREDVNDPWHQPVAVYRNTAAQISALLNEFVEENLGDVRK